MYSTRTATHLGITLGLWLLRVCGFALKDEVPSHLRLKRDRRGRFIPVGAGPVPARGANADLLDELGVTPRMALKATTPFEPPEDLRDTEAMQLALRQYVAHNLHTWITCRTCSVWTVFAVLKDTYALDRLRHAAKLADTKAKKAALPKVPQLYKDQYVAWYTPPPVRTDATDRAVGVAPARPAPYSDTRVGAGPAPALLDSATRAAAGAAPTHPGTIEEGRAGATPTASIHAVDPAPPDPRPQPPDPIPFITRRYNPDYDVVRGLPKPLKNAQCPSGYLQGFGNDPQQARDSYEAKNRKDLGALYAQFSLPCKVFEAYDGMERRYFIAQADPSPRSERFQRVEDFQQDADTSGAADGPSAYGATLGTEQRTDHGARAFCPPLVRQGALSPEGTAEVLSTSALPTFGHSDSTSGDSQDEDRQRAECPRSVALGNSEVDGAICGQAARCADPGKTELETSGPPRDYSYLHLLQPP